MKNLMKTTGLILAASTLAIATSSSADDWPMSAGDYWNVAAIDIKDGGDWKYANWLATEWKNNAEFAKSKGWISDYKILSNTYPRAGEPDLYLIRIFDDMPTGAENEERGKEYREWRKKSIEKLVGESGNRAEYREVMSSSLLQELNFK